MLGTMLGNIRETCPRHVKNDINKVRKKINFNFHLNQKLIFDMEKNLLLVGMLEEGL
jgi:hypothetical protein